MHRIKFLVTKILFATLFLLWAQSVQATDDPEISTIFKGYLGEIVPDPTGALARETIDNVYYDPILFPTIANPNNDKITNAISLFINESWIDKIKTDFTAQVDIKIEYTLLDGSIGSVPSYTLEINYTIAGGLKYNARQTIKFDQCRKVKVTILNIHTPVTYSWNVWEVLNLENRMLRKRDYVFLFNDIINPVHTTPAPAADERAKNQ